MAGLKFSRGRSHFHVAIPIFLAFIVITAFFGFEQLQGTDKGDQGTDRNDRSGDEPGLETSPPGKVMVLNANLREAHPLWLDDIKGKEGVLDLEYSGELTNFADHLRDHLPYAPDVLLLQEVIGPSVEQTALELRETLNRPYRVVLGGHNSNLLGPKGDDLKHKRNTAIIINESTMEVAGEPGFMTLQMQEGDEPPHEPRIAQEQAYGLLRDRRTDLDLAVMSIHWSTTYHFASRELASERRAQWAREVKAFMLDRYSEAPMSVMAGEFNAPRCLGGTESFRCDESAPWKTVTSEPSAYQDAVYVVHRESPGDFFEQATNRSGAQRRIDFIFARPNIYAASRSVGYNTRQYTPGFISDHKYDYALIGG